MSETQELASAKVIFKTRKYETHNVKDIMSCLRVKPFGICSRNDAKNTTMGFGN